MVRKAHVVQPAGMGRMPDCFVIVQSAVKHVYESEGDDAGHSEFAGWAAKFGFCYNGELSADHGRSGKQAGSFWSALASFSRGYQTCWLVSLDAREQMAALGLWEKFLMGEVTSNGADPYSPPHSGDVPQHGRPGFIILEAPPTIATFTLLNHETVFTWVGTENYGAGQLKGTFPADSAGNAYSDWIPSEHWLDRNWIGPTANAVVAWLNTYLVTLKNLNLGAIERTAASQAAAGYRRRYMEHRICVHDNEDVTRLERAGLYGGRCEVAFLGGVYAGDCPMSPVVPDSDERIDESEVVADLYTPPTPRIETPRAVVCADGPIYQFDVNSLYPAVAMDARLPVRLETVVHDVPIQTLLAACRNCCVVAQVEVDLTQPVAPYRTDEGTMFPVGKFATTLCGPEILLAAANGRITACHRAAVYKGEAIYGGWIRDLYDMRLRLRADGQDAAEGCVKSILNASFGKWAQSLKRWVDVEGIDPPFPFYQWWEQDRKTRKAEQWRSFAWAVQRLDVVGEPGDSFPAITAYINSLGRVRLWELIQIVGSCNVYYWDTDSLWVNGKGRERLFSKGECDTAALGKLKQVGEYDVVEFLGIKRYVADGIGTIAGATSRPCDGSDAFHLQLKAPPLAYYLRKCHAPGLDRRISRVRMNLPYKLGKVHSSGWVEPFVAG